MWADEALLAAHSDELRMLDEHFAETVRHITDAEGACACAPLLRSHTAQSSSFPRESSMPASASMLASAGSMHDFCFANGLRYFGLHRCRDGWHYREWAPAARSCSLVGDFNDWDAERHPCRPDGTGVFHVFVPNADGLRPGGRYKAALTIRSRAGVERRVQAMPAWAHCTHHDPLTGEMSALVPPDELLDFRWRHPRPEPGKPLRIYEVHAGISSSQPVIAGWSHLRAHVLPRIAALGYTALLVIAAQEHGYYASFGYQVTSFFAPPSRFGTPAELQALVDEAHGLGLLVLFELVHAHASANAAEGLSGFDGGMLGGSAALGGGGGGGGGGGYFLAGADGWHAEWGTRMFDYGKLEVVRFLLAQICWFAECYRADGFRFDAVSAAIYRHRSLGGAGTFDRGYADYYERRGGLDAAAIDYFKLANHLAHDLVSPQLITIAEEYSCLPGLCAPVTHGGVGFDYRQAMGLPPLWERLCKTLCGPPDDVATGSSSSGEGGGRRASPARRVDMHALVKALCSRRAEERRLAYVECHDQSFVGGQSFAFRCMGAQMYDGMSTLRPMSAVVARGLALHKLTRLLAYTLGGEAYLTFIGNEFGHAEWVDLPREGNGHSLEKARRRWDLADDPLLRYGQLQAFEAAMHSAHDVHPWLDSLAPAGLGRECYCCERRQLLWFVRGGCWFGFNLHATAPATLSWHAKQALRPTSPQSPSTVLCADELSRAAASRGAALRVLLDSDDARFGGRGGVTCARLAALGEEAAAVDKPVLAAQVHLPPLSACIVDAIGMPPMDSCGWHLACRDDLSACT